MHKKVVCTVLPPLFGLFAAETPMLRTPAGGISFSPDTGSIVAVTPKGSAASIWASGAAGLWSARFADKSTLDAARFHATNALYAFSWKPGPDKGALTLSYTCKELAVRVVVRPRPDGAEFSAEATPASQTLLGLDLPARLRFDPASVVRFVFPHSGNTALGAAFNRRFFERQPEDRPSGWEPHLCGPKNYQTLCGGPLVQRDVRDPATALTVTDEGKRWFSPSTASSHARSNSRGTRPKTRPRFSFPATSPAAATNAAATATMALTPTSNPARPGARPPSA